MDIQKTGRIFGWLFIGTFITSIPAKLLFVSAVGGSFEGLRFVPGDLSETTLNLAAILEFGVVVTNIATAVVLYPLAKRWSERVALGYVAARTVESGFIMIGIISVISLVSVNNALTGASGAEAAALAVQGNSLAAMYDWAFLFGPGLVVGFGNGLLLGYLMYRSGLVPRRMAMLGLVGGPMLIISFVLILFGVYENGPGLAGLMALPEIAWECSLGIYAAWKGFRPSPIASSVDVGEARTKPRMATA
jgi:hypothetical protein